MIFIQPIRKNDFNPDSGKQIELGKLFMNGHKWVEGEIKVTLKYVSLSESDAAFDKKIIRTTLKVRGSERGGDRIGVDCKEYSGGETGNAPWKRFFIEDLKITEDKGYFVLEDSGYDGTSFNLYYIPDGTSFNTFFNKFKNVVDLVIDSDCEPLHNRSHYSNSLPYITAIRTKPFLLLAGISGTGKSRIVRKLAQATVTKDLQQKYDKDYQGTDFEIDRWELHSPANFKLIQVKPNWHNSMDVVGYMTNIPEPHYVFTPFVEFIARAWQNQNVPFFLCLDEMNLAPVEEYFAEFLSAIESRAQENGEYVTDPIIKPFNEFGTFKSKEGVEVKISDQMVKALFPDFNASNVGSPMEKAVKHFRSKGLTLPKNLIVIGTVNMDETTYSFSRKVLDRAMSFEMNDVDYMKFLKGNTDDELKELKEEMGNRLNKLLINRPIEAKEVISDLGYDAKIVVDYLEKINKLLNGTPFKLGYRAANEAMLYVMAARETNLGDVYTALDDFTLMKILSRLEGDTAKMRIDPKDKRIKAIGYEADDVKDKRAESADTETITILTCMHRVISDSLTVTKPKEEENTNEANINLFDQQQQETKTEVTETRKLSSLVKLESMMDQLNRERFVSYWN